MPMKNPPHPGDLIKTEVIEALGLSISKAAETLKVFPSAKPMQQALLDKHFLRKHGPGAYYGQGAGKTAEANRKRT
mgnify:CR=1 FL=1